MQNITTSQYKAKRSKTNFGRYENQINYKNYIQEYAFPTLNREELKNLQVKDIKNKPQKKNLQSLLMLDQITPSYIDSKDDNQRLKLNKQSRELYLRDGNPIKKSINIKQDIIINELSSSPQQNRIDPFKRFSVSALAGEGLYSLKMKYNTNNRIRGSSQMISQCLDSEKNNQQTKIKELNHNQNPQLKQINILDCKTKYLNNIYQQFNSFADTGQNSGSRKYSNGISLRNSNDVSQNNSPTSQRFEKKYRQFIEFRSQNQSQAQQFSPIPQYNPKYDVISAEYDRQHMQIINDLQNRYKKQKPKNIAPNSVENPIAGQRGRSNAESQLTPLQNVNLINKQEIQTILKPTLSQKEPLQGAELENNIEKQINILDNPFSSVRPVSQSAVQNNTQAISNQKTTNQRNNMVKKPILEDSLEKDVLKKILERVEKLLSEKDDFFGKDDKGTGERVTILDQDNLSSELSFNQHLNQIEFVKQGQHDIAYTNFLKGVGRMKNNKDKSAVTAFKQALNFDKFHFPTIYNLANIYERNGKTKIAEQWLDIAALFKKNKNDINYGFAVIFYKSHRYEEAYKNIDMLIEDLLKQEEEKQAEKERLELEGGEEEEEKEGGEEEEEEYQTPQNYLYLRSLCSKKLGQKASEKEINAEDKLSLVSGFMNSEEEKKKKNIQEQTQLGSQIYYKKATQDYKAFIKYTCPKNFNLLKNFMFAIVFKKIRKMEIRFPPHIFCEFYSLVNQILAAENYVPALESILKAETVLGNSQNLIQLSKKGSSGQDYINLILYQNLFGSGLKLNKFELRKKDIVSILKDLSFFKRFNPEIVNSFLPQMELRYIERAELLFAKKGEVYIITGGHLTVFDHSKKFNEPEIVAYYSEGDIIGCNDKDNKISFNPEIWFLSITRVEYVTINENDFNELWNIQNSLEQKAVLNFIKQIDIFEHVSQLTLFRLAFELLKPKIFQSGDIVYNDGESIQKYNYIELFKEDPKMLKDLRNRIINKIDILPLMQQAIQGFYLIQEGQLQLNSHENWQQYTLQPFNFIGENLLFPSLSISRFGQIICASNSAKTLFVSRYDFHKINSLDKEVMKANVLKSEYFSNCQKILYKYYKFHKIEDFDTHTSKHQSS